MNEEPVRANQSDAEREQEQRYASILWRVSRGDTSVVSEVYWMQMIEPFEQQK